MTDTKVSPVPEAILASRALLKAWQEQHAVFRDCLPLAIGIDKQLLALYPETHRKALRMALRHHTNSMRYLKAMEKATVRHNLDGSPADEVPDTHRDHAAEQMRERLRKDAERRKMQRQAEAAAEADRLRTEKLEQLASKFSRR